MRGASSSAQRAQGLCRRRHYRSQYRLVFPPAMLSMDVYHHRVFSPSGERGGEKTALLDFFSFLCAFFLELLFLSSTWAEIYKAFTVLTIFNCTFQWC